MGTPTVCVSARCMKEKRVRKCSLYRCSDTMENTASL